MNNKNRAPLNELVYRSRYDYFSIITICALALYLLYLFISKGYVVAAILNIVLFYADLAYFVRRGYFYNSSIEIYYPLRPFLRKKSIGFNELISVKKGSGTYLDGALLIIRYRKNHTYKKVVLKYPGNEQWKKLQKLFQQKEVKVL